jgi:hypothetical protein
MMIKYRFRDWDINFVRPAAKFYTIPLPYAKRNSVILSSKRVGCLVAVGKDRRRDVGLRGNPPGRETAWLSINGLEFSEISGIMPLTNRCGK